MVTLYVYFIVKFKSEKKDVALQVKVVFEL